MRNFAFAVAFTSMSACASEDDGASGESGSSDTGADDGSVSAGPTDGDSTDPTASTDPTDPTASTDPTDPTASTDPTDPTASSESGGMTGCEDGPLQAPIAGCTPVPPASTGDFAQDCVDRINQFRWECQCLPPLARWADAETCSDEQSANDQSTGSAHGNFGACGESAQNTCPNWGSETDVVTGCLQAMWDEGPGEPFEAHGHYINMSNTQYSKVACGFSPSGQGVWANQNFSP
jgi:hypothetical protein